MRGLTVAGALAGLLCVDAVLVLLHLGYPMVSPKLARFFDLDAERTFASWWSSAQLGFAALLFGIAANVRLQRGGHGWALALLALLLLAMSADETVSVHEQIGGLLDGDTRQDGLFTTTGNWVVVLGLPVIAGVAGLLFALRRSLAVVAGAGAVLAAGFAVLFTGALLVEALSNFFGSLGSASRAEMVALEEGLEMAGGSLLLWSGMLYLAGLAGVRSAGADERLAVAA